MDKQQMPKANPERANKNASGKGPRYCEPRDDKGPLIWLHQRRDKNGNRLISDAELKAGEMLAADFYYGGLSSSVTANWSAQPSARKERRGGGNAGADLTDRMVGARQRFHAALDAIGEEHARILVAVCCHERGLTGIEREAGWPQRSGKLVLQIALKQLARHYGLIATARSRNAGVIRHWGVNGYRPDI